MDEEIFELAKENDLTLEEAKELQEFAEENDLDPDDALELWQDQNPSKRCLLLPVFA
jgi:hypothetical protein